MENNKRHQTEANDITTDKQKEYIRINKKLDKLGDWEDKQPKDYAEKDWIKYKLTEDEVDWQYENKESYAKIAKYWFFIAAAFACGYMFMLGVIS